MNDARPDNAFVGAMRATGLFTIRVPKEIVLGNMFWGAVNKAIQGTVGILLFWQMFWYVQYEGRVPATGVPISSWFDRSGIATSMKEARSTQSFQVHASGMLAVGS